MNRILYLVVLVFCLLYLAGCGNIREEFTDWEALMNATAGQKAVFPPLLSNSDVLLQGNIFNVIIIHHPSRSPVWGRFTFSDNFLDDFPLQLNPFETSYDGCKRHISDRHRRQHERVMRRLGFNARTVDFFFTESNDHRLSQRCPDSSIWYSYRPWYYFVNTKEQYIFFYSIRRREHEVSANDDEAERRD